MYTHAKRSHTHTKDPLVHDKFGGLWKHQNNQACTKRFRDFIMLKLDTVRKKKMMKKYLKLNNTGSQELLSETDCRQ